MIDYKLGAKYRITSVSRKKKNHNRFIGKIIQDNKRFFTLESDKGIRESFLKIDFIVGEYGIVAL